MTQPKKKMITTENNWYKWFYDYDGFFGLRRDTSRIFKTYMSPYAGAIDNFKIEGEKAADSVMDTFPGLKPCVFFSGGVDSEAILRSFLSIKVVPDVFIVRYEDNCNYFDVDLAIEVCKSLNVKYYILDLNLKNFFENEADSISDIAQIDRPRMLPSLKYMDMVDGLPIVGHSDVRWFKTSKDTPYYGEWVGQCFEHDIGCDKYIEHKGRPAVYQWFKWTPGLVLSYTKMRWFQELITGHYKRETEINNTKIIGYKSLYDNLIPRKKYTGFEKIDPIINEFEEHLLFKNKGLIYRGDTKRTLNQMWMEITGKPYQFTIEVSDKYKISKEL